VLPAGQGGNDLLGNQHQVAEQINIWTAFR